MAAKDSGSSDMKEQEEIEDMTTCCICTEVYTDPKALPCIHTFCLKCIQETGLKISKVPGDEMPCPICRRLFKIPADGFHGLPKNLFIERLIQVSKASKKSAVAKELCSLCLEDSKEQDGKETPTADIYCVDCRHKLCEECCTEHKTFKLTKNHQLIPVDDYENSHNVKVNLEPSACEKHKQRFLDVFCTDCKTVVCSICFIGDHGTHKGSLVDKYVDEFKKQIERNEESMNKCRSKAQSKRIELLEVKTDIQDRVVKLECDIANRIEELKQLIDNQAMSLLQGLSSTRELKLKEIQMATDDVDTYLLCLETYGSYCQKIMAKGSASDICGAFADLMRRSEELQQQCQPTIDRDIQSINFRFRKSGLEEFLDASSRNLIGEFEEKQKRTLDAKEKLKQDLNKIEKRMAVLGQEKLRLLAELRYKSDPVLVHTIQTNSERQKKQWFRTVSKSTQGMTILDKELFVVTHESSEVEVYDSTEFSRRRQWNLKELIYPLDIVSCEKKKCLYISHWNETDRPNEILRVNSTGKLINKWSEQDRPVYGLSVTDESTVILAVYEKNTKGLKEYSPDGQLIRKISLSPKVCGPTHHLLHAVKLINGDFVISHGEYVGDYIHRVCIVDVNGNLKKSFGGKRGSSIEQLNRPVYLSVDANGFVMVGDRENCRVLLLDSDLKFNQEILSEKEHGLRYPERITLDESNGRLFVADNELNNQRILVFEFKQLA